MPVKWSDCSAAPGVVYGGAAAAHQLEQWCGVNHAGQFVVGGWLVAATAVAVAVPVAWLFGHQ
jgi:hypothetical protein